MEESKEKIGFFRRLGIAIARPREYSKLANQSVANTIGTFFIVALVQVIALMVLMVLIFNFILGIAEEYIPQIPEFTISNGQLTIEQSEPIIYETDQNELLLIVDSNTVIQDAKNQYANEIYGSGEYMLIAKDGIETRQGTSLQTLYFKDLGNQEYTKDNLVEFFNVYIKGFFKTVFLVAMFIFLLMFIYIGKLIGGLIFSILGWIIANIQGKKLSFSQLFNISMYAGVTTTLMFLLGGFMFSFIPMWMGTKLVIITLYIIFAINHMPVVEEKKNDVK